MRIPPDAVFGTEEADQPDAGRLEEDVDGGAQLAVHPAGIRQQADLLALQDVEAALLQDLDAGFDDARGGRLGNDSLRNDGLGNGRLGDGRFGNGRFRNNGFGSARLGAGRRTRPAGGRQEKQGGKA